MERKPCSRGAQLGLWACLWGAAAVASLQEEPLPLFSQVFFCQRDSPFFGLAQVLDGDQLFWFDFPSACWQSRLPDFQPEVPSRMPLGNVSTQQELCQRLLAIFTNLSEEQLPEAKGIPQVDVFIRHPLELGKANTLICSVSNLFPPSAVITWAQNGEPVTQGVSTAPVSPVGGLKFELFSYLEVTPRKGDVYSCSVRTPGDEHNGLAYWVPNDPVPSDFLETLACGAAIAVGILFVLLGSILIAKSHMSQRTE
ncbi:HLA class II histocompatibility antigen, DM alpha chain [Paroedura picta]|uniref:HLA class II histocompatibility antigen, DM alpha chain n=1 Tax=Paroedura picta TaxID=143630 RepID=UPI0040575AC1